MPVDVCSGRPMLGQREGEGMTMEAGRSGLLDRGFMFLRIDFDNWNGTTSEASGDGCSSSKSSNSVNVELNVSLRGDL